MKLSLFAHMERLTPDQTGMRIVEVAPLLPKRWALTTIHSGLTAARVLSAGTPSSGSSSATSCPPLNEEGPNQSR